jgi:tetratricopeptide (TPR) repeat protein
MLHLRVVVLSSLISALLPFATSAQQPAAATSAEERAALHAGSDWKLVADHLPDPSSATPAALETAADVLRARRFPEDALDYYGYAVARGGDLGRLLNKMGIVRLELQQPAIARQLFLRNVRAHKKDAQAWNNLGVTEFAGQNYMAAITDYRRAVHLDKHSAVYHSNLGLAYFENKDVLGAREQFALAIQLDPTVMRDSGEGGVTAQILESMKYSDLCFEMARLYARAHSPEAMRVWLARASEAGFDVRNGMQDEASLRPYLNDPQIKMMLENSALLQKRTVAATTAPSLGSPGEPSRREAID